MLWRYQLITIALFSTQDFSYILQLVVCEEILIVKRHRHKDFLRIIISPTRISLLAILDLTKDCKFPPKMNQLVRCLTNFLDALSVLPDQFREYLRGIQMTIEFENKSNWIKWISRRQIMYWIRNKENGICFRFYQKQSFHHIPSVSLENSRTWIVFYIFKSNTSFASMLYFIVLWLSQDELNIWISINRVIFFIESDKRIHVGFMQFINFFLWRIFVLHHRNRGSQHHCEGAPMWDKPEVVVKDSPTKEDDWGKTKYTLNLVLKSSDKRSLWIRQLRNIQLDESINSLFTLS